MAEKCGAETEQGHECPRIVDTGRCWQHDDEHYVTRDIVRITEPGYSIYDKVWRLLQANQTPESLDFPNVTKIGEARIEAGKQFRGRNSMNDDDNSKIEASFIHSLAFQSENLDLEMDKISSEAKTEYERYQRRYEE